MLKAWGLCGRGYVWPWLCVAVAVWPLLCGRGCVAVAVWPGLCGQAGLEKENRAGATAILGRTLDHSPPSPRPPMERCHLDTAGLFFRCRSRGGRPCSWPCKTPPPAPRCSPGSPAPTRPPTARTAPRSGLWNSFFYFKKKRGGGKRGAGRCLPLFCLVVFSVFNVRGVFFLNERLWLGGWPAGRSAGARQRGPPPHRLAAAAGGRRGGCWRGRRRRRRRESAGKGAGRRL